MSTLCSCIDFLLTEWLFNNFRRWERGQPYLISVGQASCLPVRAASLPPVAIDEENTGQRCPVNRQAGCLPHIKHIWAACPRSHFLLVGPSAFAYVASCMSAIRSRTGLKIHIPCDDELSF